jgi:hypothetical protein
MTKPNTISSPPVLIQHVCFHAYKNGIYTQERDRLLLEDVSAQVTTWLNSQGATVSVLHVATTQTNLGAHATVWFRRQA